MESTFDIVIRGGLIVDGSGQTPSIGDVGVRDGIISAVGPALAGRARETLDAAGLIVTPGFVDVHTHYDGQAMWEETLKPSTGHGVTTVVMGNCGVGFAPCRPGDHDELVRFMEGVEDIPEIVMSAGLPWNWETFPDYLDALANRRLDADVAALLPHSALRVYVMGERGAKREPATPAELAEMRRLTAEAMRAGAIGVSTSRMQYHRAKNGDRAPSVDSARQELLALAGGLRDAGRGVFQIIPDLSQTPEHEIELICAVARESGAPVSFTLLQMPAQPGDWRRYLELVEQARAEGLQLHAQVFPRAIGILHGLQLTLNPFALRPSYKAIAARPLAEKVAIMRDPAFKAKLIAEKPDTDPNAVLEAMINRAGELFPLSDPPNYAPRPDQTVAGMARVSGRSELDIVYDLLLEQDGRAMLLLPSSNFVGARLDGVRAMMEHPGTILGLGDGGAHYGYICDSSYPTTVLSHWARDAEQAQRFPIETVVHMLARQTAVAVGLEDRGLIAPGYKADINLIDHAELGLRMPSVTYDLPAGGRRITQDAVGYVATLVDGVVTYRNGMPTGSRPGRLVRMGAG
jgi:N-acyl-D-aspartate/D-glutamate deacylase